MVLPEFLNTLVQPVTGDSAHSHTAHIGHIALGEHQVQLMGGHPRIRPEHLIEVPKLIQHDVTRMGLFHSAIVLPKAHTGRHGRGFLRDRVEIGGFCLLFRRCPQMAAQILLHLHRREVTALLDKLANTLFHLIPSQLDFCLRLVALHSHAIRRRILNMPRSSIRKGVAVAADAILLFEFLNCILLSDFLLIHGKHTHFSVLKIRASPQFPVNICLRNNRSGGRVRALRFSDSLHLVPLGRDFRGHKT